MTTFDAVVLAGGTGRRLGGASKPDLELDGRRLLDHALAAVAGARRTVVVAPADVVVPAGVLRTLEDPPLGGPVAGVASGLAALDATPSAGQATLYAAPSPGSATDSAPVVILAVDVPHAASAVPRLLAALDADPAAHGACLVDAAGRPQWLTAAYRPDALRRRLAELPDGGRGARVRALVEGVTLAEVRAEGTEAADVDTWDDLEALRGTPPVGP